MKRKYRYSALIGLAGLLALAANAAPPLEIEEDHDDVMEAVEQGLIQPFSSLQAKVSKDIDARIIKVELDEDDGVWIYELKLIDANNNIVKVEYEAKTLSIIEIKGRGLEHILKVTK
ncbi:membrane protein [Photobacterium marinum]|uniref:Membrane protein n=1 Tax=Photobacterium marinum TaxID=1056511 RepID=L8JBA3_9GAMM|nr:PepSY domain-containing protein [Photobacterium marinum]ELR65538.1 membrane protein [Photobacterium marinum]